MNDNRAHPLLQQVPLTVSIFVNLPTATTLPYTYIAVPSALPPSVFDAAAAASNPEKQQRQAEVATRKPKKEDASSSTSSSTSVGGVARPRFVISASGAHAAHPDDILASCQALSTHLDQMHAQAEQDLQRLKDNIWARELAEKRKVAPGWLDSEAKLLTPERKGYCGNYMQKDEKVEASGGAMKMTDGGGPDLNKAFGGMTFGTGT